MNKVERRVDSFKAKSKAGEVVTIIVMQEFIDTEVGRQ
jgi:hypothetical protein